MTLQVMEDYLIQYKSQRCISPSLIGEKPEMNLGLFGAYGG